MDCTLKKCVNRTPEGARCEWCKAQWRAYGKKRRRLLNRLGKCANDGNERAPGKMTCQRCLDRCVDKLRRLRARCVAEGKCMRCASPVATNPKTGLPYTNCDACRKRYRELYPQTKTPEAAE